MECSPNQRNDKALFLIDWTIFSYLHVMECNEECNTDYCATRTNVQASLIDTSIIYACEL